jgi:hypothetical protein
MNAHNFLIVVVKVFTHFELCAIDFLLIGVSNVALFIIINYWLSFGARCMITKRDHTFFDVSATLSLLNLALKLIYTLHR